MHADTDTLPPIDGDFVLLRSGPLQLLLPQVDVGAAGHLARPPRDAGQPGLFEINAGDDAGDGDQAGFVIALSPHMTPMPEFPDDRFLLTSFSGHEGVLVCWDEARVLSRVSLQPRPLPTAMLAAGAPVDAYVEFGEQIAFLCTGERLLAHAFASLNRSMETAD